MYLDNSDWLPSSSYDTLPKDEIKSLQMKLSQVEQTNLDNMTKLKEITNSIEPHSIFDIDSPDIKQDRFDNLINLIYALQMKQFAESICGIKKDNNSNRYLITFEKKEKIEQLTLNEEDYNELISFRDPLNSISVYDLFQEKTYSYYNANPGKDKKDNRQLSFQVGKKVQVEYDYCHHCKQRKPGEIMIQCKSHLTGEKKCTRPNRVFHVNGTTVVRSKFITNLYLENKSLIIGNYNEDPNEFVELTAKDEGHEQCKKFFCHFCLRGSYDTEIDNVKDKSDWVCPYCQGQCFCSRCTRNDKLLKLIAYYISIGGDINLLYDNLVTRNKILDLLNPYMVLSKIFVINNDTTLTPAQVLKKAKTNNKLNLDEMDKLIDKCEMYKDRLEEIKSYFNDLFAQAKVDKNLLYYENEKTGEYKENKMLQRKRGRSGQSKKKEEKITRRNRRK